MEAKTLVKKLYRLPELYKQIRQYQTGDLDKQVELGLRTNAERTRWLEYMNILGLADQAKRKAEGKFKVPDYLPLCPKESQELIKRMETLAKFKEQYDDIKNTLLSLRPYASYSKPIFSYGISSLAENVWQKLNKSTSPEIEEYYIIRKKIENKEREGSKVKKVRREIIGKWNQQRTEVGTKAYQEVLDQHQDIISQNEDTEQLVKQRVQEKVTPLYQEMAKILRIV